MADAVTNFPALQLLLERDPLELTDDNIEAAVAELRSARSKFLVAEKQPKEKRSAPLNLSLADLFGPDAAP